MYLTDVGLSDFFVGIIEPEVVFGDNTQGVLNVVMWTFLVGEADKTSW